MKRFILLTAYLLLLSCNNVKNVQTATSGSADSFVGHDPDVQPLAFLDSIAKLDPDILNQGIKTVSDSVFMSHQDILRVLSVSDFEALKKTDLSKITDYGLLRKIFPERKEHINKDMMPRMAFYHFSENKFDKFAVEFGDWLGSTVYFFVENKMIARHDIYHKYGLELESFVNENNEVIIYYKVNFISGTDIFHNNYNFYMYDNDKLLPILNEIENTNLGYSWTTRSYWLETAIVSTSPLALKMVYGQSLPNTEDDDEFIIVKDSAVVRYSWDSAVSRYTPDYSGTGLSNNIILSYYLADNELLFINTHHTLLKKFITGNDSTLRKAVVEYINTVREAYKKAPEKK